MTGFKICSFFGAYNLAYQFSFLNIIITVIMLLKLLHFSLHLKITLYLSLLYFISATQLFTQFLTQTWISFLHYDKRHMRSSSMKITWLYLCLRLYVLVAQLCLTLWDPMDCSAPGSFFHGILQEKILEWVAIPFSRGSSRLTDWTYISCIYCITGRFFTV